MELCGLVGSNHDTGQLITGREKRDRRGQRMREILILLGSHLPIRENNAAFGIGLLDQRVNVDTRGGVLSIHWAGDSQPVWMTGPAVSVFEGEINLEESP